MGPCAVCEFPGNSQFSEGSFTAFSASPVFLLQGGPKPLVNLQVTSEIEEEQNFLSQSFPATSI